MSTLVAYILPPGDDYAARGRAFFESYEQFSAGADHDFLLILKADADLPSPWPPAVSDVPFDLVRHDNEGQDIGSLQRVAQSRSDYDLLMWMGTHSRILADGWLAKFQKAIGQNMAAASATGSFEAGISGVIPNPHIRTNVLMIAPAVLNSLAFVAASTRTDCYEFEHGHTSLYRRLDERGLRCAVVGRDGRVYREQEWASSRTYRREEQQNLLIADKQTDAFAAADPDERLALARMAGWEPE